MASIVDICNLALGNIRSTSINDLSEGSIEAQVCKQRYQHSVDYLLRGFPWQFAHKVEALALRGEEPSEWVYAYDYPSECLSARYIVPNFNLATDRTAYFRYDSENDDLDFIKNNMKFRIPFKIGLIGTDVRVIFTDQAEAKLAFTKKITDPSLFPVDFIECLSWHLASMIAIPIAGSETGHKLRQDALNIYQQTLRSAQADNANEGWATAQNPESPTITARR